MNLKILAGLLPLLLLSVSVWLMSKPDSQGAPSNDGTPATPTAEVGPSALESKIVEAYNAFDFGKIFVLPAGPKGLEYSAVARGFDGKKVRLAGSMVRHLHEDASLFILADQPMSLNVAEYGLADSLPPNAVHVILPVLPGMAPDWVRQPMVIYGTLELGPREEKDGRISQVRLHADHITAADGRTVIEPRRSILLQPARLRSGKL
ncbi:MAG: hypothetical protein JWL81_595 [Verrucomicrobiales bacterium]|nr:hypothetical protein [Verrucomicrobiales bacterium]